MTARMLAASRRSPIAVRSGPTVPPSPEIRWQTTQVLA